MRSAGSTPAFGTIYIMDEKPIWKSQEFLEKLRVKLYQIARSQFPDKAEDLVQEAIYLFLDNLSRGYYRGMENEYGLIGYAIGILKHLIIKEIRDRNKRKMLSIEEKNISRDLDRNIIFRREGETFLIEMEEEKEREEFLRIIKSEMKSFPLEVQELIYLHVCKRWSYSRLSRHFGIPKQTLVYKFNTAMEKIRKKIKIFIQFGKNSNNLSDGES